MADVILIGHDRTTGQVRQLKNEDIIVKPSGRSLVFSEYDTLDSPFSTTSATFVDVDNGTKLLSVTITLDSVGTILVLCSFQGHSAIAGGCTFGLRINIVPITNPSNPDDTGQEFQRFLSGTTDTGLGTIQHRAALNADTYSVDVQMRRVSGNGTPELEVASLSVIILQ